MWESYLSLRNNELVVCLCKDAGSWCPLPYYYHYHYRRLSIELTRVEVPISLHHLDASTSIYPLIMWNAPQFIMLACRAEPSLSTIFPFPDLGFLQVRSNLAANSLHLRFDIKFEGGVYLPCQDELPKQVIGLFTLVQHLEFNWFHAYGICDTCPEGSITSPHLELFAFKVYQSYTLWNHAFLLWTANP